MCNALQFMKIWRQSSLRREHVPSSLAECLDQPSTTRREYWRIWLIILFILLALYYLKDLILYEEFKFSNRGPKYGNVTNRALKNVLRTFTTDKTIKIIVKGKITRDPKYNLPLCTVNKPQLGKFTVRRPRKNIYLENKYPMISKGGYYSPVGCQSRHKVGILIPYRDREQSLSMFLFNIHPFLMKQKLEYRIFVVEQKGTDKFNKGRLFNAGFEEMMKFDSWQCIVFHDVDLIPLDERIQYSCPSRPRHMCATVVQKIYDPTYHVLFGGVTSMTPEQYVKANGYSNLYWGWGGEDNDMFWRLRYAGLRVTRYSRTVARYISLPHEIAPPNPLRYQLLHDGRGKYKQEGLSTLEYKLVSVTERPLYTHIVVDINPAREINANPIKLLRKLQD